MVRIDLNADLGESYGRLIRGAIQVPASGQPLVFGADHPVTGGYPVIAVITERAADDAGQLAPGDRIRFETAPGAGV